MGNTRGARGFIHLVQPRVEEAAELALTVLALMPEMKQPQPPSTQSEWLYWVRVATVGLDANEWIKSSSECPGDS